MTPWWRDAVIYQVYVRSFADSNGDGVGDLPGLIDRLDYLEWLGVDAIWCSPITPSPDRDFGYDVSGYTAVHPVFGTLADADRLIEEARRRGIRVLLDIVPNHSSDRHPWFRDPARRDWYVWADRPNNWRSHFGGPAWTFDRERARYYLHNFLPEQPDLNWWSEEVREEFDRILRFWFERGIAGFRIDVCHAIVKDRLLRDNPPATPADNWLERRRGQRFVYNENRPEVHEVLRRWRRLAEEYQPPRLLMGETYVLDVRQMAKFYGDGDELQLAMNFPFVFETFDAEPLRVAAESTLEAVGPLNTAVWLGSNHDVSRFPTRWCSGDERKVRLALTMLLTLPGACVLYQGDEIGMTDVEVPPGLKRDAFGKPSRDPERTPMQWSAAPNGGFTNGQPWLPLGDFRRVNVQSQARDPASILNFTRRLIGRRRGIRGGYRLLRSGGDVWAYRRGRHRVTLDFGRLASEIDG